MWGEGWGLVHSPQTYVLVGLQMSAVQPRTQALHCFYRDQRQLIIQARKGASTLARLVFSRVDLAPLRAWH